MHQKMMWGKLEDKLPYSIYFISNNISKVELNYTITENEVLAIFHSLNKFMHYITLYHTFVKTKHPTINYLMNKPYVNTIIIICLFLLEHFDLKIVDKLGKENVVADLLSRLILPIDEKGIMDNQLPDENLFTISTLSPCFFIMDGYLVVETFPVNLSFKEKRNIIKKNSPFTLIGGNLFKLGPHQILRRCVREEEVFDIVSTCHDGPCGGHFSSKRTTFKYLQVGYYWPTLHQDVRRYTSRFE